jgi:hypothetical protein
VSRDEVVLIEVMAKRLDRQWWADYSSELKRRFRQDELVIRALVVDLLGSSPASAANSSGEIIAWQGRYPE